MVSSVIETYTPLIIGTGAFIITYFLIPVIIRVSHKKNLCDDPGIDHRKLHIHATPTLGGVAMFAAVVVAFYSSGYAFQTWAPYLVAGLTVLFFSGVKDDIYTISPLKKLLLQIFAVAILMGGGGLLITDLGGVFGIRQIPYLTGIGLTLFTMVVVINAFNLIDGIDGLAGGVGIITSTFFAWWFWQAGMSAHAVLAISLACSLLAFLRFNFSPASIFMGDTGSQIIGFILTFFAVSFVKTSSESLLYIPLEEIAPVLVLAVLIVPLYDTLRVFLVRVLRKTSPFQPDRLHLHHQLLDMGFSQRVTCYIIYCFNITVIALAIAFQHLSINALLAVVLGSAVALFPTVNLKRGILTKLGMKFIGRSNVISQPEKQEEEQKIAV